MKQGKTGLRTRSGFLLLGLVAGVAHSAELRFKYGSRGNPARTRISVDAQDLLPTGAVYSAQVASGRNIVAHAPLAASSNSISIAFLPMWLPVRRPSPATSSLQTICLRTSSTPPETWSSVRVT
jgi:hypothetical protein